MIPKILPLIPKHQSYVEVFGGGAGLLFAKHPSPVETYNDLDSRLVNFFRVLRQRPEEFYQKASFLPYSREEFYHCRDTYEETEDELEKALKFFVVARMSFGGFFGRAWGFDSSLSRNGMAKECSRFMKAVELTKSFSERLRCVQIEHYDFRKVLDLYDTPETFFYLDPPYVESTRRDGGYKHEMTDQDHKDLVDLLLSIRGKAILSGYGNDIYLPLESAGWGKETFSVTCRAVAKTRATGIKGEGVLKNTQKRVECLWISPNARTQLSLF